MEATISNETSASPDEPQIVLRPQPGPQTEFFKTRADIAIYGGAAGGGKRLSVDTPVPTPNGWETMGSLKAGMEIFDEQGRRCVVEIAHEIVTPPTAYRITFDDDSTIDADAEHLWLTFSASELSALTRRDPEWRRARRAKRPSKVGGKKSALFTISIAARNRLRHAVLAEPRGTVRTTTELARTLRTPSGRANHAIPVAKTLELPERELPSDPYLLGLWLGDGTARDGRVSSADHAILDAFCAAGHTVRHLANYDYRVHGLTRTLRGLGVLGHKHVPASYLRASQDQRLALLQGLMDTDGTVAKHSGAAEFTTTSSTLRDAVQELIVSLGWKARAREGRAKLHGKDCGPKWTFKWVADRPVFRLERKRRVQRLACRRTTRFRYLVACDEIMPVPMRCITVDSASGLFLAGRAMIPTHNTWALEAEPLRYIQTVPGFGGVMFRRTSVQVLNKGGMWDESFTIYPHLGAESNLTRLEWTFPPHSNRIRFGHMEHEKTRFDWQGAQIPYIGWDELTHFTEEQFFYMLSRNRSTCGVRPYVRATTNPDADSWVANFISWWIHPETGLPIPEIVPALSACP